MTSLPAGPVYAKRVVCNVSAGKIAAVVVIALASGVLLAGLSQERESRCSLVWTHEGGPAWLLKASPAE
jgi:hypothetical protein